MTSVHADAAASWKLIAERIASCAPGRQRDNLSIVAEHVEAEVRGDVDDLLATLVADPQYRFYGSPGTDGPKGRDAVVAHYEGLNLTGMNRLEFAVTRVVVDDDHVVTEGVFRHALPTPMVKAMGASTDAAADVWHLVEYPALVVWPVDASGKLVGEDIYFGGPMVAVRTLADGEMPHLGPLDRP